jgi:nucleoside-diphosphate-sugar epimerase
VTGGLGFIGSNLALALAEAGADVTVIDALIDGHGGNPANVTGSGFEVIVADIGDSAAVAPALRGAECVFDVAGQVSHLASGRDPARDFALNAVARLQFLETLRRVNPETTVVYTSTRQVYGAPADLPIAEETLPQPADVNGVSKLAAEHLHLLPGRRHKSVVLRLSNVYGPRQHLYRDDLGFLPVFIRRALRGEPLIVFGKGTDVRDPLHVDDVVEAILAAALTPEAAGLVINVGGAEQLSLLRIAELVATASTRSPPIVRAEWPPDHARVAVGSAYLACSRAATTLGWGPKIAFADGVERTLAWFGNHPERYR